MESEIQTKKDFRICKEAMDDPIKFEQLALWGRKEIEIAEKEMFRGGIPGKHFDLYFKKDIFYLWRILIELTSYYFLLSFL